MVTLTMPVLIGSTTRRWLLARTALDRLRAQRAVETVLRADKTACGVAAVHALLIAKGVPEVRGEHLGRRGLAEMRGAGELDGDKALELACRELRALRQARSRAD